MKSNKINKKNESILIVCTIIILILAGLGIFAMRDLYYMFGEVTMEQLIFNLRQPMKGVQSDVVWGVVWGIFKYVGGLVFAYLMGLYVINKTILHKYKFRLKALGFLLCTMLLTLLGIKVEQRFEIIDYYAVMRNESSFIEDNYVDPELVSLEFPEEKRNLIYIFSESLETTYLSLEAGGAEPETLMPNLEQLALDNTSFYKNGLLYGPKQLSGTGWTAAGMMAQTSGLPLKLAIDGNSYGKEGVFAPGVYSIGEVLEREGYSNYFRMGSEASYAGRDVYLITNGNYNIYDYHYAVEQGEIPETYYEWWGYEDQKLFARAKEDLARISEEDEYFNYSLLTVDTHFADGYVCDLCEGRDARQYANVIMCQDRQISDFIDWIKEQDFYENTTIIISGDHLSMDTGYFETITDEIERMPFFTIINGVESDGHETERLFTDLDIYPTTLAAMGVEIEGNKLGLGRNLYSDEETLIERLGYEELNQELRNYAPFYDEEILGMKTN